MHMKICSILLIIREIQTKTTKRYHFTSVRMASIRKTMNVGWECGEKRILTHCRWERQLVQPLVENTKTTTTSYGICKLKGTKYNIKNIKHERGGV